MKKFSILLLGCVLIAAPLVYSQNIAENQRESSSTSTAQKAGTTFSGQDYSSWSVFFDFGLNAFFGDMSIDPGRALRHPSEQWSFSTGIEYTINPMLAIGLGYTFHRLAAEDNRGAFESSVHNVFPYIGVNLLNYPLFRRNNRWDLWVTAGFGFAQYTPTLVYRNLRFPDHYTEEMRHNILNPGQQRSSSGVIPLGIELSYNITPQLAVALRAQYFMYGADDLEGAPTKLREFDDHYNRKNYTLSGASNDMVATFGLALRWNITGRDRTHMRRVTWEDFSLPAQREPDLSGIMARLDTLENRMENLNNDVTTFMHSPIVITETITTGEGGMTFNADGIATEPIFIFFDFDRYNLDHTALAEVLRIATILNENPGLNIDVVGFTDIRGSTAYNQALSNRRARAIRDELVNIWGISPNRITHEGRGKALTQPDSPRHFSINRRCEVRFYRR